MKIMIIPGNYITRENFTGVKILRKAMN